MQTHKVTFTFEVVIEHEESLLPDADWRKTFYGDITTHAKLAEFLAYNMGILKNDLNKIDGFYGIDSHLAYMKDCSMVESEVEEIKNV